MNRNDILLDYDVDKHGIIRSPGKFEGEMLYVPYLWIEGVLNGGGEPIGENEAERVKLDDADRAMFPELDDAVSAMLWETDSGFVYCKLEGSLTSHAAGCAQRAHGANECTCHVASLPDNDRPLPMADEQGDPRIGLEPTP